MTMKVENRNYLLQLLGGHQKEKLQDNFYFNKDLIEKVGNAAELWFKDYKEFEKDDTVEDAFTEQRLTVKGMDPVWYSDLQAEWEGKKINVPNMKKGGNYPLDKGINSMKMRIDPEKFLPKKGGDSLKTEYGLHDISTALMSPNRPISEQQYKSLTKGDNSNELKKLYMFMPLGWPQDQTVFQLLNDMGKVIANDYPLFYERVRYYRARMTRTKLAAENDMKVIFKVAGYKKKGEVLIPRFRYTLGKNTDVAAGEADYIDEKDRQKVLEKGVKPSATITVTPELLERRRRMALDYTSLILNEQQSPYGEITIALRQHAGDFPKFTKWSSQKSAFVVGDCTSEGVWIEKKPETLIANKPTRK